jgi:hypothetical protein
VLDAACDAIRYSDAMRITAFFPLTPALSHGGERGCQKRLAHPSAMKGWAFLALGSPAL